MERRSVQSLAVRGEGLMQKLKSILMLVLWLTSGNMFAQVGQQRVDTKETAILDAEREKRALQVLAKLTEKVIVSAADAMPADKYGFAPTDGEFKGVRTFGQMVKHLSATNYILAAAALGEEPTRLALMVESLVHAFDHYGQMVEYLRMNGVVPPASRP